MKRFVLAAAATACISSAAYAETSVAVAVPSNISDKTVADQYVSDVRAAVNKVCRTVSSPVIGVNYYRYRACVEDTQQRVAGQDPTGLLSGKAAATSLTVAAR